MNNVTTAASAAVPQQYLRQQPSQTVQATPLAREILLTRVLIAFGLLASIFAMSGLIHLIAFRIQTSAGIALIEAAFAANVIFLMYGSLFYEITRLAFFKRLREHRRVTRAELEEIYSGAPVHRLAILVPSYKEEPSVVRLTLMSAALTEYPNRKVVLLIDDPPEPADARSARQLATTRELVREINTLMQAQARRYKSELAAFRRRVACGRPDLFAESRSIAQIYNEIAAWFEHQAATHEVQDHYDSLYVERILREPAREHRQRAAELESLGRDGRLTRKTLRREYRRIAALFAVEVASFERKRYVNLSHASNKAMNLNSYLGLIGSSFREEAEPIGLLLKPCEPSRAHLKVPDADYVITLDADSLLLNDYALRLTHIMDRPESAKLAVVESPYTAVPEAPALLERIAGAQTDVQWIGSQGATYYNASFWVGANALLRRAALEDICEIVYERGFPIKRYIQDRTPVEDTESTIDLVVHGWGIYCHPERLSYSATPRDYGSLVIQRRRWANGPLLIVPKLLRYALTGPRRLARLPETILRLNTLTSALAAVSMLLVISLTIPDARQLPIGWLTLSAVPYYILYFRDMNSVGYDWWDLPRVYGLNLLLIPVNLAGVIKSLYQACAGIQPAFLRTPKVPGRTSTTALYVVLPIAIWMIVIANTIKVLSEGQWSCASFGMLNGLCLGYAIVHYVGLKEGLKDLVSEILAWTRRGAKGFSSEIVTSFIAKEG